MAIQRLVLLQTRNYLSRQCILQSTLKNRLSFCEIRQKYSSEVKMRKYTDQHEWVTTEKDIGTVGITKYAQESLGDIVFAQLPDVDTKISAGDECGALESVKAASEIYSPVSGVVVDKNSELEKKPGLINSSCYDKGWLFKIKITKAEELNDLMSEAEYETFLKTDADKDH
ncbi:glycine cleavage system H protein-like [Aricia agestis]|uniref:glycine cleavage system H protein-like n=1 Tax=Aricia agestis TaxID=91739 RepID=UPI001C20198C|nr:glycine cleavage system H protein-like [Aricia agestis]XP_041987753.1 glycine cleavage system H protein-like [Aricia agestis]